jgi:hypothetical protein
VVQEGVEECDSGGAAMVLCDPTCSNSNFISQSDIDQIRSWGATEFNSTWISCYDSTRDGFDAGIFHDNCDNQGASVTIAHLSTGKVIGGYNSTSWRSQGSYVTQPAFLFSITNNFKHQNHNSSYYTYDGSDYGPTFGGGHDWVSFRNTDDSSGNCNLGHSYACRVGGSGSSTCRNDFCGNYDSWSLLYIAVYVAP